MAHPKHEQVRRRYRERCGYCGVAEIDAAGELTVDHHRPTSSGGDDSDDNLVYCCSRCNLYKGDFFPSEEDQQHNRRVLHPLKDELEKFVRYNEDTGELEPLTDTGKFHITLLHLNRPALVAYRNRQRYFALLAARRELIEAENLQLRAVISAQEQYIALLRHLFELSPPEETG